MVDAVGGIDLDATRHMDGAQALAYVRDRSGAATGDRALRQQSALRAMLEKAASGDTLSDPIRLYDFLDAATQAVGVDDALSNGGMRALALKLSDLRPADVLFVRVPVASVGQDRGGAVIRLDPARSGELWTAVRSETARAFLQQNSRDALGPLTR
jgi:anionic cell wall polymer biosynthesis LytR-Cps2A-Psr (LCP) family protein